jgi:DNA processing protein
MALRNSSAPGESNLYSWLLLALTPRVGPATMLKLIHHFGSASAVVDQSLIILSQFVNKTIAQLIVTKHAEPEVIKSLAWVKGGKNRYLITLEDARYPKELAQMSDPPLVLYLQGQLELLQYNKFAIVGTRHPSEQGSENALRFGKDLANNGLTIVSGMAAGIDRHAHLGALQSKPSTIGVIGTGIDIVYPKTNLDIFEKVVENGLLISEFPLKTPPLVNNFPRRNRIIAGLSLGCLVIESAVDGGSLITANLALEMGREVMAIPGSIFNPVARGCHKLIKSGAKLVETANDVLEELRLAPPINSEQKLLEPTHPILAAMGFDPIDIDKICLKLNMSFVDICAQLLELELAGLIMDCGGGRYQRIFK